MEPHIKDQLESQNRIIAEMNLQLADLRKRNGRLLEALDECITHAEHSMKMCSRHKVGSPGQYQISQNIIGVCKAAIATQEQEKRLLGMTDHLNRQIESMRIEANALRDENKRLRVLTECHIEYEKLLVGEIESLIPLAIAHGWKSTRHEKGVELRAEIASAEAVIGAIDRDNPAQLGAVAIAVHMELRKQQAENERLRKVAQHIADKYASASTTMQCVRCVVLARAALATQQQPSEQHLCLWTQDNDGVWNTGCGQAHVFEAGTPGGNDFGFCPYCGNKLGEAQQGEQAAKEGDAK